MISLRWPPALSVKNVHHTAEEVAGCQTNLFSYSVHLEEEDPRRQHGQILR